MASCKCQIYFIANYQRILPFYNSINCSMYEQSNNPPPAEVQIQRYQNAAQKQPYKQNYTDPRKYQEEPAKNQAQNPQDEAPSTVNYCLHIVLFTVAFTLNLGVWAIDFFAVGIQASNYYTNSTTVSSYTDNTGIIDSTLLFITNSKSVNSPVAVAMSLIYSWLLWKLSLVVFSYEVISREQGKNLRIGTTITLFAVLVALDILLTIFALSFYNDAIFFAAFILLAVIVALVNSEEKGKTLANLLVPLLLIAFIYFTYSLLIPTLYGMYKNNLSLYSYVFLIMYGYPIIDLSLYCLTLGLGSKMDDWVKGFFSTIHYLLLGYGVGMIMLAGYTQVQFYYLIAYFIFRNIFVNYIMRRWEKVVYNPPALPGWIVCYYISYALSFLPIIGVGKVVVAKSFSSYLFAKAITVMYGTSNPLYPSTTAPTSALSTNISMSGNIYWLAAAIIWVAMTFSQRYNRHKPTLYDLFYYLFGIHLFYFGISCSLSLPVLYVSSTLS